MIPLRYFIIGMAGILLSDWVQCTPLQSLETPLNNLKKHFNINHPEVGDGGAKFTTIFRKYNSKTIESGIMLNAIVRWYLDLFENMKPSQDKETKESINILANGLQEWLRTDKYFSLLNDIKELENVKRDDYLIPTPRSIINDLTEYLLNGREISERRLIKFAVTSGRFLPHLCEFVNMTSIGKCNVLKKALRFYGQFLKRYGQIPFLSADVRRDLKKIKDYTQNINSKMECGLLL
ncbi:uncharacterized protein LOC116984271 [Amblyraja radiata]|uniref:uncharacterized protein LOC116984271 n=1 Tax=Amblyraja radiata TaxID=386614 RepID=UPI0014041BFA|nr:uncharacterized protein LOC116984271 [Amblyraja radiata]